MSTRAFVVIHVSAEYQIGLYRHHDGMLAGVGAMICRALDSANHEIKNGNGGFHLANALIRDTERFELAYPHSDMGENVRYEVKVWKIGDVEIKVTERHSKKGTIHMNLEEFRAAVNKDVRRWNAELEEAKKERPGFYKDWEFMTEV